GGTEVFVGRHQVGGDLVAEAEVSVEDAANGGDGDGVVELVVGAALVKGGGAEVVGRAFGTGGAGDGEGDEELGFLFELAVGKLAVGVHIDIIDSRFRLGEGEESFGK